MFFFGVCKRADISPLGIGILEDGEADVADGDVLLSAEGVGTGEDRDRGAVAVLGLKTSASAAEYRALGDCRSRAAQERGRCRKGVIFGTSRIPAFLYLHMKGGCIAAMRHSE